MQGSVPLVDMQVRGHVCGETRSRRGPSHGLQGKVVGASLLHAHVPEVEALGAQRVCAKQRLRGRQVTSVAPRARKWRRVHGSQRRGHLHGGGGWRGVVVEGCGNERWRVVVLRAMAVDRVGDGQATGGRCAADKQ